MEVYQSPTSMETLLPVAGRETLAKITCDILAASGRLTGQVHSPEVLRHSAQAKLLTHTLPHLT